MSTEISVNQDIKDIINDIIVKCKLNTTSSVTYNTGSEIGDGFLSKTIGVNINDGNESLELFLKWALNPKSDDLPFHKLYANEIYFYEVIYPIYIKFLEDRNVKDGFKNVPKFYGTSNGNIVVLENLKKRGFTLFNKYQIMNDNHITLVLKTLAKFHAISFAYKDQESEKCEKLVEKVHNIYESHDNELIHTSRKQFIDNFLKDLKPTDSMDKFILEGVGDLADNLVTFLKNSIKIESDYSILTQGDCWCNNILFSYEGEDRQNPTDVMLIDWQMMRSTLPVYDISFFFYSIASEETLDKLKYYLKIYHEQLSEEIRKLGSDPEILYPYSVLEMHWKEHGKYGFAMAFLVLWIMLSNKDETISFEEVDFEEIASAEFYRKIKNYDEYARRLKILTKHFIINNFL